MSVLGGVMFPSGLDKIQEILKFFDAAKGVFKGEVTDPQGKVTPFASVSIASCGHKFVIKGFVDNKKGPVVKFSCPWGQLGSGQIYFLESDKAKWEETTESEVQLSTAHLHLAFERSNAEDWKADFHL